MLHARFILFTDHVCILQGIGLKGKTLDPEKGSYVQADFEKAIELSGELTQHPRTS